MRNQQVSGQYRPTLEGWLYLATVIDCYSKKVIGWATADHYRTPLIEAAIDAAVGNIDVQPEAVFHSDRGSNGGFNWWSQRFSCGGVLWVGQLGG